MVADRQLKNPPALEMGEFLLHRQPDQPWLLAALAPAERHRVGVAEGLARRSNQDSRRDGQMGLGPMGMPLPYG